MNAVLVLAALMAAAAAIVHSMLGERKIIGPLLAPERRQRFLDVLEKSALTRGVVRFAWHVTSVAWLGLAAVLVALASAPPEDRAAAVAGVVAATFFVTGSITLVASRGRHLAWPVFFAIAALCLPALF